MISAERASETLSAGTISSLFISLFSIKFSSLIILRLISSNPLVLNNKNTERGFTWRDLTISDGITIDSDFLSLPTLNGRTIKELGNDLQVMYDIKRL